MIKLLCDMTKEELIEAHDAGLLYVQDLQEEMDGVQQKIYQIADELVRRREEVRSKQNEPR